MRLIASKTPIITEEIDIGDIFCRTVEGAIIAKLITVVYLCRTSTRVVMVGHLGKNVFKVR